MSPTSLVLSHQPEVVMRLKSFFKSTTVVTAASYEIEAPSDLEIISTNWKEGQRIRSALRFMQKTLPILVFTKRPLVVFSHMTEVQSLLIAPICRLLGIRHFLWYAHASNSIWLNLASPFLTGVLTSTPGSCPLKGKKIHVIGQGVPVPAKSQESNQIKIPPIRWYHVSRIDASKRIEIIGDSIREFREQGLIFSLDKNGKKSSSRTK